MRLYFDLWSIIFLCAASLGYFLFTVLLMAKQNRRSNRLLAFLILAITVLLTESLLSKLGFYTIDDHRHYIFFTTPVIYVIGPLFYLYARSLFPGRVATDVKPDGKVVERGETNYPSKSPLIKGRLEKLLPLIRGDGRGVEKPAPHPIYHFLPFIICFINYLPAYLILIGFKPFPFMPLIDSKYFFLWISGYMDMGVNILQTAVYLYFALGILKSEAQNLKHLYANSMPLHIERLKILTGLMFGLMGIFTIALIVFLLQRYIATVENVLALSRAAVIYAIGYLSIKQPEIPLETVSQKPAGKYQNSPLSDAQIEAHIDRLIAIMASEKPYLNSELKLPDLAKQLSLSTNHLSQILNQNLQVNFFDFINQYRVKAAQEKLLDPACKHLTNLAIAYDAGFNSKASFNRAFKKYTGLTPSQFVKSHALKQQV